MWNWFWGFRNRTGSGTPKSVPQTLLSYVGVQLYLRPYREAEANTLKAVVDGHILLTFLVSFMLRVLSDDTIRSFEPLQANFYGWIIVFSMMFVGVAGVGLTTSQIRRRRNFRTERS